MSVDDITKHVRGVQILKRKEIECHSKAHMHNEARQTLVTLKINDRFAEVTQEGDQYHVRLDGDDRKTVFGLSFGTLVKFFNSLAAR